MKSTSSVPQGIASRHTPTPPRGLGRTILRTCAAFLVAVLFAGLSGGVAAQSFTENFDDITTLPGNGWLLQNNSTPVGATGWFQGTATNATPTPGPFDAFNGALNAYIGANFNNTGSTGTISNWLVAPNRTLRNGDVLTFYTRKPTANPTDYPDRLELRLSTNGASTNVGSGATAVGDFVTLLLSVNPSLVTNVYPQTWTQFTVTLSGLPAPTSGRAAFRYFVTGAGSLGSNSDYIGIDNVVYTPYVCPTLTLSPASGALAGGTFGQAYSTALTQTGALGAPSYAVVAGALPPGLTLSAGGTLSGTPTATGTFNFSVIVADNSGCTGSASYSITVAAATPGAPQNVVAVAGDAQATVSFDIPASDGGDAIIGYTATCTDGVTPVSAPTAASPVTVGGLVNGVAYTCTVAAINGVGTGADSAPSNTVTPMGNQTITFPAQAGQIYSPGGSFAIDPVAVASSGLEVSYASTTPAVCTVSGSTVSIIAAGTCTITADQAGDVAWHPAPQVSQSIVIAQASQMLTFPAQTEPTRVFDAGATFAIDPQATSATPNSGEPIVYSSLDTGVCTVSGTTVTMVAEGLCTLAANQAGNADYAAAAQVAVDVALVEPTDADLWIEKSADVARARIGDTVAYTIEVGNLGPADATDVEVLDLAPERLSGVVWECLGATGTDCPTPAIGSGDLDVVIASLPAGASLQFELFGTVAPAADPADDYTAIDNTATVALPQDSTLIDPSGNNSSTASVLVIPDAVFADGFEAPVE